MMRPPPAHAPKTSKVTIAEVLRSPGLRCAILYEPGQRTGMQRNLRIDVSSPLGFEPVVRSGRSSILPTMTR